MIISGDGIRQNLNLNILKKFTILNQSFPELLTPSYFCTVLYERWVTAGKL